MNIEQLKKNLSSDLYDQIKIIDGSVNDEQTRHNYLEKIAKLLFKDSFNLSSNCSDEFLLFCFCFFLEFPFSLGTILLLSPSFG